MDETYVVIFISPKRVVKYIVILLKIRRTPVVIMDETATGKTRLIRYSGTSESRFIECDEEDVLIEQNEYGDMKKSMTQLLMQKSNDVNNRNIDGRDFVDTGGGASGQIHSDGIFDTWYKLILDECSRNTLADLNNENYDGWIRIQRDTDDGRRGNISDLNKIKMERFSVEVIELRYLFDNEHWKGSILYGNQLKEISRSNEKSQLKSVETQLRVHGTLFESVERGTDLVPIHSVTAVIAEFMKIDLINAAPITWVTTLIAEVLKIIGNNELLVIFVVGTQSSEKSTLLNTMFGLQSAVNASQCPKRVFCLSIPEDGVSLRCELDFILEVDTGGSRASELEKAKLICDKGLVAFVIEEESGTCFLGTNRISRTSFTSTHQHNFMKRKLELFYFQLPKNLKWEKKLDDQIRLAQFQFYPIFSFNFVKKCPHSSDVTQLLNTEYLVLGIEPMLDEWNNDTLTNVNEHKHILNLTDLPLCQPPMATVSIAYSEKVNKIKSMIMEDISTFSMTDGQWRKRLKDSCDAILNEMEKHFNEISKHQEQLRIIYRHRFSQYKHPLKTVDNARAGKGEKFNFFDEMTHHSKVLELGRFVNTTDDSWNAVRNENNALFSSKNSEEAETVSNLEAPISTRNRNFVDDGLIICSFNDRIVCLQYTTLEIPNIHRPNIVVSERKFECNSESDVMMRHVLQKCYNLKCHPPEIASRIYARRNNTVDNFSKDTTKYEILPLTHDYNSTAMPTEVWDATLKNVEESNILTKKSPFEPVVIWNDIDSSISGRERIFAGPGKEHEEPSSECGNGCVRVVMSSEIEKAVGMHATHNHLIDGNFHFLGKQQQKYCASRRCSDGNSESVKPSAAHPKKKTREHEMHEDDSSLNLSQSLQFLGNKMSALKQKCSFLTTIFARAAFVYPVITYAWFGMVISSVLIKAASAETAVHRMSVLMNQSVKLDCMVTSEISVEWMHKPVGSESPNVVFIHPIGIVGYYQSGGRHSTEFGTFNLIISNVSESEAGEYTCMEEDLDENVVVYDIVVLKSLPECSSSIPLSNVLGENECGIDPDRIRLDCVVMFHGNFAPALRWRNSGGVDMNCTVTPSENELGSIRTTLAVEASRKLNGTYYACGVETSENSTVECRTPIITIPQFLNSTSKELHTDECDDIISCNVDPTDQYFCQYSWTRENQQYNTVVSGSILNTEYFPEGGRFQCTASCQIRSKMCATIIPFSINLSGKRFSSSQSVNVIVLAVTTVCFGVMWVITTTALVKQRFKHRRIFGNRNNKTYSVSVELLKSQDVEDDSFSNCTSDEDDVSFANSRSISSGYLSSILIDDATSEINVTCNSNSKSSTKQLTSVESNDTGCIQFEILRTLGAGGSGTAYLVEHKKFKKVVFKKLHAMRVLEKNRLGFDTTQYIKKYVKLSHPNIVKIFDVYFDSIETGFFLEYVKYGPVDDFIEKFNVSWQWKIQVMNEIAMAMSHLHNQQPCIIHGDLKPQNIFIDKKYHAKVSDFEFECFQRVTSQDIPFYGSLPYIAPEYLKNPSKQKTEKFDVYSFAISAWEILSEKHHSQDFQVRQLTSKFVIDGQRPLLSDITGKDTITDTMSELIQKCWDEQDRKRPSFEHIENILSRELEKLQHQEGISTTVKVSDSSGSADKLPQSNETFFPKRSLEIKTLEDRKKFVKGFKDLTSVLTKYLDSEYGLIQGLLEYGVLTNGECRVLNDLKPYIDKNNYLILYHLAPKICVNCKGFVRALIENEQEHIVKFIMCSGQNNDADRLLSEEEMKMIDENMFRLVDLISPHKLEFFDQLVSKKCITIRHKDKVESYEDVSEGIKELLNILKKRRYADFCSFKLCLRNTMNKGIVELLEKRGLQIMPVKKANNEFIESALIDLLMESVGDVVDGNPKLTKEQKQRVDDIIQEFKKLNMMKSSNASVSTHQPHQQSDSNSDSQFCEKIKRFEDERITGVTWLQDLFYVVCENTPTIHVFSGQQPYKEEDVIEIPGIGTPCDIASSTASRSVYIIDGFQNCFWMMQMPDKTIRRWEMEDQPRALSINSSNHLLLVVRRRDNRRDNPPQYFLNVYKPGTYKGIRKEQIKLRKNKSVPLPEAVYAVYSAVQLSTKKFVICYREKYKSHEYLFGELSSDGKNLNTFSDYPSSPEMIPWRSLEPLRFSVNTDGDVYVAVSTYLGDQVFVFDSKKKTFHIILKRDEQDMGRISKLGFISEKRQLIVAHSCKTDLASTISMFSLRQQDTRKSSIGSK